MAKKKEYDELYPDEDDSGVLKVTSIKKVDDAPTTQEKIKSLLDGAMQLLNRNLRHKERAFDEIRKAIKLIDEL